MNGKSEPARALTDDGQVASIFNPGTFIAPPRETAVRIRITPVNHQPLSPADIVVDGNAYAIDATYLPSGTGPAALQIPIRLDLRYPGHQPEPVYRIDGKAWTPIGGTVRKPPMTIDTW